MHGSNHHSTDAVLQTPGCYQSTVRSLGCPVLYYVVHGNVTSPDRIQESLYFVACIVRNTLLSHIGWDDGIRTTIQQSEPVGGPTDVSVTTNEMRPKTPSAAESRCAGTPVQSSSVAAGRELSIARRSIILHIVLLLDMA